MSISPRNSLTDALPGAPQDPHLDARLDPTLEAPQNPHPSESAAVDSAFYQATMRQALKLAKRGPKVNPNPRVGAIIVNPKGETIGQGWHNGAGTPHAEVAALSDATTKGHDVFGGTLIVTLEPCNHQGTTGPCTKAILAAGIAKVIYAVTDPGAKSGGGAEMLKQNGIEMAQLPSAKADKLVRIWAHSVKYKRPYVTLKIATTLDGKVAAKDGTSKWITGTAARNHAHKYRAQVGAIIVGTGTVLADNPALTARQPEGQLAAHQPQIVIIGQRPIPQHAQVWYSPGGATQHRTHSVADVLSELYQAGIRQVLVEGGPTLAGAMLAAGVVDEIQAYLAPLLLGDGKPAVPPFGPQTLNDAVKFHFSEVHQLGNDIFLRAQAA